MIRQHGDKAGAAVTTKDFQAALVAHEDGVDSGT
jgi:hypothetical protein